MCFCLPKDNDCEAESARIQFCCLMLSVVMPAMVLARHTLQHIVDNREEDVISCSTVGHIRWAWVSQCLVLAWSLC